MARPNYQTLYGFGERLYNEIAKKNLTGIQVGNAIGCDRKTVYSWYNGETVPNALQLAKICSFFNVSADYMLFGKAR